MTYLTHRVGQLVITQLARSGDSTIRVSGWDNEHRSGKRASLTHPADADGTDLVYSECDVESSMKMPLKR